MCCDVQAEKTVNRIQNDAAYVITEVKRVVGALSEGLVKVIELSEHALSDLAQHGALDPSVLDLLELEEVLCRQEELL